MANTNFGVNDPLAVKRWSNILFEEALKETQAYKFIGGSDNVVVMKDDVSKQKGDKVTYGLRMQLTQDPHVGDSTLRGEEEKLVTYSDAVLIDLVRHGVAISNADMSEQRVPFDIRKEAKDGLQDYFVGLMDYWFFNQLCCFTPVSSPSGNNPGVTLGWTGQNTPPTVDSAHQIFAGSSTNDQSITTAGSSNVNMISLALIDSCILKAKTLTPMIRPIKIGADKKYVLFIHPQQAEDLRTSANGSVWLDLVKVAMQGRDKAHGADLIYGDAMGEYHNTIIYEDSRITNGVNSGSASTAITTVRRSVFCGAQAACIAFGRNSASRGDMKSPPIYWREQLDDYQMVFGVSANMIGGMKTSVFNNALFGSIIVSTYSAS